MPRSRRSATASSRAPGRRTSTRRRPTPQPSVLPRPHSAEFLAALLNAQPMGFYPPATLVRDGQRRGVETRPPDLNLSGAACTIEDGAVRVGLRYVQGVGEDDADAVVEERARGGPFVSIRDLAQRTPL